VLASGIIGILLSFYLWSSLPITTVWLLGMGFLILFREAYPINVINNVRNVNEVATIYCATSNPVQVIVAEAETSRSVIGIVDGLSSRAIESEDDKQNRSKLLRDLGYKK
jgi:uncharacterized protein